jgi:hypothetical protein
MIAESKLNCLALSLPIACFLASFPLVDSSSIRIAAPTLLSGLGIDMVLQTGQRRKE